MTEKETSSELTPLQTWLYETIRDILEGKEGVVEPCVAHIREIRNSLKVDVEAALDDMCRRNILTAHYDVNKNQMYKINGQDGD